MVFEYSARGLSGSVKHFTSFVLAEVQMLLVRRRADELISQQMNERTRRFILTNLPIAVDIHCLDARFNLSLLRVVILLIGVFLKRNTVDELAPSLSVMSPSRSIHAKIT